MVVLAAVVPALGMCTSAGTGGTSETEARAPAIAAAPGVQSRGGLRGSWARLPDSAMSTVRRHSDDDFEKIQTAWSGAACARDRLVLWGGGHGDGNNNMVLALSVKTGEWTRVTEPSPVWRPGDCPGKRCRTSAGPCRFGNCAVGPDGRPVSRHTYYYLAYYPKDNSLYSVAGSIWRSGKTGPPPRSWRFSFDDMAWHELEQDTPISRAHGSAVVVGDALYVVNGKGRAIFDLVNRTWTKVSGSGYGGKTGAVYVDAQDRFYFLGNGVASTLERAKFGDKPRNLSVHGETGILERPHLGMTYHPPSGLILLWHGGADVVTLDPNTHRLDRVTLDGDVPPKALDKGTFGRFSWCGGRVTVVSGVDEPAYVIQ